jgi:hypothetical protein
MSDELTIFEKNHQKFIQEIVSSEIVWGLISPEGYATSSSNDYEDAFVIPFWSERSMSEACRVEEWKGYTSHGMTLREFLEDWCIGMHNDGLLVGTEWDSEMNGMEAEPLDLALDILKELKNQGKHIPLQKFAEPEELEGQIQEILKEE